MARTAQRARCERLGHDWDFSTALWHDGKRSHPCKDCLALFTYGTVRIAQ